VRGSSNTNQKSNPGLLTTLDRVSARLLLILIHRPRRQAEWRDLSGGGSAATVWRSQMHREEVLRSKPEAMRPDEFRSEGTPSFSERAERWGKRFLLTFLDVCKKVSRRKGETASRSPRRNGYSLSQPEHGRLSGCHREQAHSYRKANRRQQKTRRQSLICGFPV